MIRAVVIAACIAGGMAATAWAETPAAPVQVEYYQLRLTLPAGGAVKQTLTRTTQTETDGKVVTTRLNAEYLSQISRHPDGFRVVKSRLKNDFRVEGAETDTDRLELEKVMQAAASISDITYIADVSLTPLRLENWPQLRNRLKAAMRRTGAINAREGDAFDALYGPMTAETAAEQFLPEDALLAIPHNLGLSLNNPYRLDSRINGPFGGTISARETLTLTAWDEAAGQAEVLYESGPTREALDAYARQIRPTLEQTAARTARVRKKAPVPVGDIRLDIGTTCRYRISLHTGLVSRAECQSVRDIGQGDERRLHRENWVLSETPA